MGLKRQAKLSGFSMVEIVLAVGILGFCLAAVLGLLPTGIGTQRSAQDEARATSALTMVASAAESLRFTSRTSGSATWAFPTYFSDSPDPSLNPTLVWVGQGSWNVTFFVSEGGLIIPTNDTTTTKRQTLYVKVYPPQVEGQPIQIYAAVAWPYKPTDTAATIPAQMTDRQGFFESFSAYTPKSSY